VKSFPLVYVIILTWNGKRDTIACLESLRSVTYPNFRTILVDNASADGTVPEVSGLFPDISIIENGTNLRFAGGNNVGIREALGRGAEYVLLLNNDTLVEADFLTRLVEAAQETSAGFAGPKIYFESDRKRFWYAGGRIEWWKGWISHIGVREPDRGQYDRRSDTGYVTGCCVLASRGVVERIGLLDEAYFIYGEDADWSVRGSRAGFRLIYEPASIVYHKVSVSTGGHFSWFKNWNKLKSQLRLLWRYAPRWCWVTIPWMLGWNVVAGFVRARRST
jgi:GT2 family glycosyltransferase